MLGLADTPKEVIEQSEAKMKKYKAIISSMTPEERKDEKLMHDASRIKRVAKGSGDNRKRCARATERLCKDEEIAQCIPE